MIIQPNPGSRDLMIHTFLLERLRIHAQFYLSRQMYATCTLEELTRYLDYDLERCVRLVASMAQGETAIEEKKVDENVVFQVFATPWDHIKYRWKNGRTGWLPDWIKKRIHVRYEPVVKTASLTVPVQIIRACPHVTEPWGDRTDLHVSFLKPLEWGRRKL